MPRRRPNIILVSWDSVRADHLPFHGYDRLTTPFLNEIAKEGVIFDQTYVSGVGTPTSFTGIFTGEHAHASQTCIEPKHWKEANKRRTLLSEVLQEEEYHTGAFHANALMSRFYGWDRGWDHFEDNLWTETPNQGGWKDGKELRFRTMVGDGRKQWVALKKTVALPTLRKLGLAGAAIHTKNIAFKQSAYASWEDIWGGVENFIESAPEPWFLWILLVDTHHPWTAPRARQRWPQPGLRQMYVYNYVMRRWPSVVGCRNQKIVNAYDNELRHADAFLVELDKLLDDIGNDPVIIMHSDHGDELGEHDDYGHAPASWETVTRVPLVMMNTGKTGVRDGPHSLLNLGSTILDLAESTERLGDRPSYFDDEYEVEPVYIENRELDGTITGAYTDGVWKVTSEYKAYHLPTDPFEQTNRFDDVPEHLLVKLLAKLSDRADEFDEIEIQDGTGRVDAEVYEQLKNLGYT